VFVASGGKDLGVGLRGGIELMGLPVCFWVLVFCVVLGHCVEGRTWLLLCV